MSTWASLHDALDSAMAAYMQSKGDKSSPRPSTTSVLELMRWLYSQVQQQRQDEPPDPSREITIARALDPLSPEDEAALCAFVSSTEKQLVDGFATGWRLTRYACTPAVELILRDARPTLGSPYPTLTVLEINTRETGIIEASGGTVKDACTALSKRLLEHAMEGAPSA